MVVGQLFGRLTITFLRGIQFLGTASLCIIFSVYIAWLTKTKPELEATTWLKAAAGIGGAGAIWTFLGFIFTCCFGGVSSLTILGAILDILFIGANGVVAYFSRHGLKMDCSALQETNINELDPGSGWLVDGFNGSGFDGYVLKEWQIRGECSFQKSGFWVAVGLCVLFALTALLQPLLGQHSKKYKSVHQPKNFSDPEMNNVRHEDTAYAPHQQTAYGSPHPPTAYGVSRYGQH